MPVCRNANTRSAVTSVRLRVANKKRICDFAAMPVRSCRVTIQDMDGVSQTVEVTAATLYEAVAQGLAAIRGNEWVAGIAQGFNVVKVSVADVRVEHEVKLGEFTKWLEKAGGSPRDEANASAFGRSWACRFPDSMSRMAFGEPGCTVSVESASISRNSQGD